MSARFATAILAASLLSWSAAARQAFACAAATSKRRLLLLDLLAHSLEISFHLRFEGVPLQLQLRFGNAQGGFARFGLRLGVRLKLIAPLLQIGDQLIGLRLRTGFHLAPIRL